MTLRSALTLAAFAASWPLSGASAETRVCYATMATDEIDIFNRWTRSASVEGRERCGSSATHEMTFALDARGVVLNLRMSDGRTFERVVPWLEDTNAPFEESGRRDRLSELAVLLEGLLAEERATIAQLPAAERREQSLPSKPSTDELSSTNTALDEIRADPPPARFMDARAADDPSEGRRWWQSVRIDARALYRLRSPSHLAPIFEGRLSVGRMFAQAGFQLASTWSLAERPVQVGAVPLALGVRMIDWRASRSISIAVTAALVAERISMRRMDVDGATHAGWDLGAALGAGVSFSPFKHIHVGLDIEVLALPTGHEVVIPDGPSQTFGRWGAQAALVMGVET